VSRSKVRLRFGPPRIWGLRIQQPTHLSSASARSQEPIIQSKCSDQVWMTGQGTDYRRETVAREMWSCSGVYQARLSFHFAQGPRSQIRVLGADGRSCADITQYGLGQGLAQSRLDRSPRNSTGRPNCFPGELRASSFVFPFRAQRRPSRGAVNPARSN